MISALDSSVILDVLTADPKFAESSEALLRQAATDGKLVIGECVLAENCPCLQRREDLEGIPRGLADRIRSVFA